MESTLLDARAAVTVKTEGWGTVTEKLLLVIGVTTLCMLSPGPDMVLVMRNTLTRDRRSGAWTALGVLTGNLVHIGYCAFGVGWLIARSPT